MKPRASLPVALARDEFRIVLYNPDGTRRQVFRKEWILIALLCRATKCQRGDRFCDCDWCLVAEEYFNAIELMKAPPQLVYVWDGYENSCYTGLLTWFNSDRDSKYFVLGPVTYRNGYSCESQADLEEVCRRQPWWNPVWTYPTLGPDPIPF